MYFEKLIRNEINSIYFVCRINLIKELGGAKKYELCSKLEKKLLNVSVSCHVLWVVQDLRTFYPNKRL